MKKTLLLSLVALAASAQAQMLTPQTAPEPVQFSSSSRADGYYEFSYANLQDVSRCGAYGDANVDYRVCIVLNQPDMVGYKIYGVKVYGYLDRATNRWTTEGLKDFSAWMNSDANNVAPNIAMKAFTPENGYGEVFFDEPYEITSSGVAVGYNFSRVPKDSVSASLWSITSMPVSFSSPKGLENSFLWTTGKSNFASFSDLYGASTLVVYMKKDDVTADCMKIQRVYGKPLFNPNDPLKINLMVTNTGSNSISNITYSYTLNGQTQEKTLSFASPMKVNVGLESKITVDLGTLAEGGLYPCNLTITKVNGQDNTSADKSIDFQIKIKTDGPKPEYQVVFSHGDDNAQQKYMGLNRKTTYFAAMKLQNPAFSGMTIVGAEVVGLLNSGITNPQIWLTKELNTAMDRTIDCVDGEITGGKLECFFDFPTVLTDDGIYIGYNLTVEQLDATTGYPIPYYNVEKVPNSMFMMNPGSEWYDYANMFGPLTIRVYLQGDVVDNGAVFGALQSSTIYPQGQPITIAYDIINKGTTVIENIDYSYVLDDQSRAVGFKETNIKGVPGATRTVEFPLPELNAKGLHALSMSIDKVNGVANTAQGHEVSSTLCVPTFEPKKRPLMEEFTGLWCGWCPRGWMAMKLMNERDSTFIGAAYHYNDAMQVTNDFPVLVSSYPGASIDRGAIVDPFYGSYNPQQMGIQKNYDAAKLTQAYADLGVSPVWSQDSTKLTVTGTATFGAAENGQYSLGFIIIENDLFNADGEWKQVNYYGTNPGSATGVLAPLETMGKLIGDKFYCDDMVYDEVVINADYASGIEGSLPAQIELDKPYQVTKTFDMSKVMSLTDYNLLMDRNKVEIIMVLVTPEGRVGNAIKVPASGQNSGIGSIATDDAQPIFFDLMGRRVANPSSGIYIMKRGSKSVKVIL